MSGSYWTKRRRVKSNVNKQIAAVCNEISSAADDACCPLVYDVPEKWDLELTNDTDDTCSDTDLENSATSDDLWHYAAKVDINELDEIDDEVYFDCEDYDVHTNDSPCGEDMGIALAQWATKYAISMNALGELLSILQKRCSELPKDPRTLLKTATADDIVPNMRNISNGYYYHFGIETGIKMQIKSRDVCSTEQQSDTLSVQINVDGVPLFKSTNGQFWPILGRIDNPIVGEPYVIGIFYGVNKPSNLDFLHDFIAEYEKLKATGIIVGGSIFKFRISAIICDAPARAFLKDVKIHTAYSGCERCTQTGVWNGKMTFPDVTAPSRTDESFQNMLDTEHHKGKSCLSNLGIGMVSQFVLDYMHLICLGVVRRLVWLWLCGPLTLNCRMGAKMVQAISDALLTLKTFIPTEFARKPRSLSEWQRWKATEYRQFLLYTGPVVLHGKLPDAMYNNFLLLSVGIRLLLEKDLNVDMVTYAHQLLISFVTHYSQLYGADMVVYNVHNVIHLSDDYKRFGSLDSISAFCFENYLGQLVKLVRKPNKPLEQVVRRLLERIEFISPAANISSSECVVHLDEHSGGFVPPTFGLCKQYKKISINGIRVSISTGNNCIVLENEIVLVRNIIVKDCITYVIYQKFCKQQDFFTYPLNSSRLEIYKVGELSSVMSVAPLSCFKKKNIILPYRESFVVFPFAGTLNNHM